MSTPAATTDTPAAFDCPGNYIAGAPTTLKCAKCTRPLLVKDAKRTPTGYVCPYFIKARVATFYNATPLQHVLVALLTIPIGIATGWILGRLGGFLIWILFLIAPAAGGAIAEIVRRVFKGVRGQYFWLVAAIGTGLGAAGALLLGGFGLNDIFAIIGLVLMIGALIARLRM
jgi:hypothetical protein